MSRTLSTVFAAAILGLIGMSMTISAQAADASVPSGRRVAAGGHLACQELWRCGPAGCNWHRVCTRQCPDGYSCAPLYGAYGPYGGVGFWGAFTDAGWAYQN
jgi:hypothetical protein